MHPVPRPHLKTRDICNTLSETHNASQPQCSQIYLVNSEEHLTVFRYGKAKLKRQIMKQTLGSILSIGGLIGVIFFGYQYMQDSESFELMGADVAVSTGDYVPILISLIVLIAGIVLYRSK